MHETLTNFISSYGYISVFVLVALESLGIPLPGETALITAAAFAGSGRSSIYILVPVAAIAAILGDNCGYWIGRKGGLRLVRRYGRALHVDETKIERAREFFDNYGAKTVFFGRFIALLRTWAAVLAGVACMRYAVFMFYNALGGVIWATLFGTLGFVFGRNLPKLEHYLGQASLALALLAALVVALLLSARWFRNHSSQLSADISAIAERIGSSQTLVHFRQRHPQAWEFIVRRFQPGEYLGLHLTIGLLVSGVALWLFGGITEDVIHHDPLTQFDITLMQCFHAHTTPTGLIIFRTISLLGSPLVMTCLGILVAAVLAVRRLWFVFAGWVAAFGGAGVLDTLLKHIIRRPRPVYAADILHEASFSFPSGHAMGSLVGYGMLAYVVLVLWVTDWRLRVFVVLTTCVLVLAIGISRLYLGVHYFSDVVGGYAAGILWLTTCITGVELARRQRQPYLRTDLLARH